MNPDIADIAGLPLCPCGSNVRPTECCISDGLVKTKRRYRGFARTDDSMPGCYLSELGGCGGPLSREHTTPEALLLKMTRGSPRIRVRGFPWQKNQEFAERFPGDLTSKILCKKHNEGTSDLDSTLTNFFEAISNVTSNDNLDFSGSRFALFNGADLELAFLKHLVGSVAAGVYSDREHGIVGNRKAPLAWLEPLATAKVPPRCGLYFAATPGDLAEEGPFHLNCSALIDNRCGAIIGTQLRIAAYSFRFLVVEPYPEAVIDSRSYRPMRINFRGPTDRAPLSVGFSWWPNSKGRVATATWSSHPF